MKPLYSFRRRVVTSCLLTLGVACWLTGAIGPFAVPQTSPLEGLIDLHCHTAGLGTGGSGCYLSPALRKSYKMDFYLRSFGVTRRQVEKEGDALVITRISERLAKSRYVSRAVILALDGVVDAHGEIDLNQTEIYVPNEFVAAEVAKHPNLLFGASVNPYRPDALERLEWAKAHGAVLIKWLPSIQHIDPADPRLTSFYLKLVELNLPLLSHTGTEHSFTHADDALCDPARLRLPLSCGVRVIAAHAATPGSYEGVRAIDRLAALMVEYPNLYADLSSLTQLNKPAYLGEVIRRPEFKGRVLYGSDYPLIAIPGLTTAWHYPHRISLKQMWRISHTTNPWDRDLLLKQSLGVPREVWHRSESILALPQRLIGLQKGAEKAAQGSQTRHPLSSGPVCREMDAPKAGVFDIRRRTGFPCFLYALL